MRLCGLRHTHATLLRKPSKVVAKHLGHASTTLTDNTYAFALPGMRERASERMRSLLFGENR